MATPRHIRYQISQGFTLIELVVVMGVIALIAVFSLSSYFSYRKSIALSLAVDSLQSAVKTIQQQARSGKAVDGKPACYGLQFVEDQTVRLVTATYQQNATSTDVCVQPVVGNVVNLMEGIRVQNMNAFVYALPPRGELISTYASPDTSGILHLKLQFGNDASQWIGVKMSLPFGVLQKE